jgi:ribosomal protein S27AE
MSDAILKKLEAKTDRRGFLRGSGLLAAALAGAVALPPAAGAQDPQQPQQKKGEENKDEPQGDEAKKKDGDQADVDPYKQTKLDEQGKEYRMCPQCGSNMYRQDRTWTCENCGYSYLE